MTQPTISGISPLFIVADVPATLAFYRDKLGFEIMFRRPTPDVVFRASNSTQPLGITKMAARRTNNLIFVLCLCASSTVFGEPARVCELAVKRGGLVQYAVQVDPDQDGSRTVKADIDLDGSEDELRWFGSGNSTVTLTLSSNNKRFTLEQQRLSVVKFESRFYVVTTRLESGIGPWQRDVFAVTREGIAKLCSFAGKGQEP
jgi:catechol 2,3-dioxygenase-like lactoylglutathione lyase family enzyme